MMDPCTNSHSPEANDRRARKWDRGRSRPRTLGSKARMAAMALKTSIFTQSCAADGYRETSPEADGEWRGRGRAKVRGKAELLQGGFGMGVVSRYCTPSKAYVGGFGSGRAAPAGLTFRNEAVRGSLIPG